MNNNNKTLSKFLIILIVFSFSGSVFAIPAMYQRCEPNTSCGIGEYVFEDDGYTPITTDDYCQITITNPNDVVIANSINMLDKNDGWYYYSTSTLSSPEGTYRAIMCCDAGSDSSCIDKTFVLGTSFESVADTKYDVDLIRQATFDFAGFADAGSSTSTLVDSELTQPDDYWNDYRLKMMSGNNVGEERTVSNFDSSSNTITASSPFTYTIMSGDKYVLQHETRLIKKIWTWTTDTATFFASAAGEIWGYSGGRTLTSIADVASDVWSYTTRSLTSRQIATSTEYIAGVTSSSTITQVSSQSQVSGVQTDVTTIKNNVATLISEIGTGNISAIKTKTDTIDWTDVTGIVTSNGQIKAKTDTIDWTNITGIKTKTDTIAWTDITGIKTKTDTIVWTDVTAIKTNTDTIDWTDVTGIVTSNGEIKAKTDTILWTDINTIRSSQQAGWTVLLSDFGKASAGDAYRTKLTVLNYESVPTDASSTPTITIYDTNRTEQISSAAMIKDSSGVYHYNYTIPSSAVEGVWETVVSTLVDTGKTMQANDYWEVTGSPAQVKINSISDNTVSSISANITITNEGTADYEYQYEYCVVDNINNECGDGDDTDYALGAKLIATGQDWTTNLNMTVSNIGTYWFKLYVYYGTERSVAIKQFDAVADTSGDEVVTGGGGGGGGGAVIIPTPTTSQCSGADFNHDGVVNSVDFSILLFFWKTTAPFANGCVDINQDNNINATDFSILLYQWGGNGISASDFGSKDGFVVNKLSRYNLYKEYGFKKEITS